MNRIFISFYLRANRIHIFIDTLRCIGSPKRICFLMDSKGKTLVISPYKKKDFKSHRVSKDVYHGCRSLEISSQKLCQLIAKHHNWDKSKTYRIPGTFKTEAKIVVFNLLDAEIIE